MSNTPSPFPRMRVDVDQDQHRVTTKLTLYVDNRPHITKVRRTAMPADNVLDGFVVGIVWSLLPRLIEEALAQLELPI